jgi:hypothetical protein
MNSQSGDEQLDHATCVVAGAVAADAEVADATHRDFGLHPGADLSGIGCGIEQLSTHGQHAVEEIGVQSLESGVPKAAPYSKAERCSA